MNIFCSMEDIVQHNCGIFGVIGNADAAKRTYLGLYALQHRGQESAGIVSTDGKNMYEYKGLGLVGDVFSDDKVLLKLLGDSAIGHNRYSTTGSTLFMNTQPFLIKFHAGQIAASHNGNIVNAQILRNEMEQNGSIFRTTTDSEVVLHLIAYSRRKTIPEMVSNAISKVKGAFSMLFLTSEYLIGVKDPNSFRPLVLGKKNNAWFLASESCAFDLLGVDFVRCLAPGELIILHRDNEPESFFPWGKRDKDKGSACIFEFIYFSRPDSYIFGESVEKVRREMGAQLAREHPADADIVIAVPDSSNTAALGFSQESGIPFELGLIRNHYIGRTFIQPTQHIREIGAKLKYSSVRGILKNKRVAIVDDSIVRGTTSKQLVQLIRDAGASEIHIRIASPPIVAPCYYGIDTPDKDQLIAANMSVEQIRDFIGADSLGYLSLDGLLSLKSLPKIGYCTACFGSPYPVKIDDKANKDKMGNG